MFKIILILFAFVFSSQVQYAQVTKENDLDFLIHKIRKVYAGYSDKVNGNNFEKLIEEVRNSKSKDTFALLSKISLFFKDCHLTLFQTKPLKNIDSNICKLNVDLINKLSSKKPFKSEKEGYWINDLNSTVIYLRKLKNSNLEGYVIASKRNVMIGAPIIKLSNVSKNKFLADFIDVDEGTRVFSNASFKFKNILVIGAYSKWRKVTNYSHGFLKNLEEFEYSPSINFPDSNSVVIKMPDFSGDFVKVYDSIFESNSLMINKSKNLILDIRNNLGGTTKSFKGIIPFVCTKNTITVGTYKLCSQELIANAQKNLDSYKKQNDSVKIFSSIEYLNKLVASKDKFMYSPPDTFNCTSKNYIKNVAIIMNNCTRSAAELMVLYLSQSNKVKLFGQPSGGAVDYLDILTFKLPVSNFYLWVASAKRHISKGQPSYDNIGIKPDIFIDDSVMDWVSFVKKYYENK